jgi:GNAT superfamily N-acetyltransferase
MIQAGTQITITIRDATEDDAPRISALLTQLAEDFIVGDFAADGRKHLLSQFTVPEMQTRLRSREYRFQVAEHGAELLGIVAVRAARHLQYLFVAKSHHRIGLARRLWTAARIDAIQSGNVTDSFTVNASAYAVPAYERLGFRCAGPMQEANGVRFQPMELVAQPQQPRTGSYSPI